MKIYLAIFSIFLIFACSKNQSSVSDSSTETTRYDSVLAKKVGADQYGMGKYVMAFLRRGPNRPSDPKKIEELQRAHLDNIHRLAEEGKLLMAGPFLDDSDLRGIYVFDVETIEEAKALTETDPAIKAGSLVMELKPWYGSAALRLLTDIYPTITKEKI